MNNSDLRNQTIRQDGNKIELWFTLIISALIIICSGIGLFHEQIYSKETVDWLSQTIGQDISNLFIIVPILLISSLYASRNNKTAKIIWAGTMITNVYSYAIYCFDIHFNFLFHIYCIVLGLSIYSLLYFFVKNINANFKNYFNEKAPIKVIGIPLFLIGILFVFLWLSNSLPAALTNTVPDNIKDIALPTNPVQVLDFSFYLPLIFISSVKILKKKSEGYFLAPMMMIFGILTNINIISLMIVSMQRQHINNVPPITIFSVLSVICLCLFLYFVKSIKKPPEY